MGRGKEKTIIMWKLLALCLVTAGFVSGNPLPVSSKDSPSSFHAKDDWFLSDLPGKKSEQPTAEAVKGASSYGGHGSVGGAAAVEADASPSKGAVVQTANEEPHADPVMDAGASSRRNNMM